MAEKSMKNFNKKIFTRFLDTNKQAKDNILSEIAPYLVDFTVLIETERVILKSAEFEGICAMLKHARKKHKLTQAFVSSLLFVSPRYLRDIENIRVPCSSFLAVKILQAVAYMEKVDLNMTIQLDYLRVQFPGLDVAYIMEKVLRIKPRFFLAEENHTYGYAKRFSIDQVWLFQANPEHIEMGMLIQLGGQGCAQMEQFLKQQGRNWFEFLKCCIEHGGKFTRIDLAINDYDEFFKLSEVLDKLDNKEVVTKFRSYKSLFESDFDTGEKSGITIYLGSQSSLLYLCFYQKNYEIAKKQKKRLEDIAIKNRYEMRFAKEYADAIGHELVDTGDMMGVAKGVLKSYIRFLEPGQGQRRTNWPTWYKWQVFLDNTTEVLLYREEVPAFYERSLAWLQSSVAPTLKMVNKIDLALNTTELPELIHDAELTAKHQQIIEFQTTPMAEIIVEE